jgi:hypothetical protein
VRSRISAGQRTAPRHDAVPTFASRPSSPALGAPEGAVVAAFERIDVIASDAMAEIVADGVEPDRALADHAFAHRLAKRAGSAIMVGPGPLVVAPDLTAGLPSDPATRAGRALALQVLGVALARTDGLAPDQIIIGAMPPWVTDESAPAARAIAEVAVRRAVLPATRSGFVEPAGSPDRTGVWPYLQSAAAVHAGDTALVLRTADGHPDAVAASIRATRAASAVAADVAAGDRAGGAARRRAGARARDDRRGHRDARPAGRHRVACRLGRAPGGDASARVGP